jgi:hypothetical protein
VYDSVRKAVDQEKVVGAIDRFRAVYVKLQPYERKELIRLVVARAEVSKSSLRLQFHGNPASEEVFDKVKAPEGMPLRRFEPVKWLGSRSGTRTKFLGPRSEIQPVLCLEPLPDVRVVPECAEPA